MATTRTVLEQRLAESLDDYRSLSLTSTGGASGANIVDTKLARYAQNDNAFPFWFIELTSGSNDGDIEPTPRTGNYTASSKTLTPANAFSAQIASGVTYLLHRIDPVLKRNALNRAAELLFHRGLYLPVSDETLVVDQLLTNGDLETWSGGAATGWTLAGAGATQTQETTRLVQGSSSALIAASGADATFGQNLFTGINVKEVVGRTLSFKAFVFATAASTARLRVTFDGTNYTNGDLHGGADEWEGRNVQQVIVSVPEDATEITVQLWVLDGGSVYLDDAVAYVSSYPTQRYTVPTTFIRGPAYVLMQADEDLPNGAYHSLGRDGIPVSGRRLRLLGKNYVSRPASDADTMEVEGDQVDLVVERAKQFVYEALAARVGSDARASYKELAQDAERQVDMMLGRRGVLPVRMGAEDHTGAWHIQEDGEARSLVFLRER